MGVAGITKEEVQTISVCQMILITCSMEVGFKDGVICMEWNMLSIPLNHYIYSVDDHNVPCALCYVATRDTVFMIPAKVHCPTNWTVEYTGYLMTEYYTHRRSTYECVDKDPESVPGLDAWSTSRDTAYFYHVEPNCSGLPCSPYDAEKELTCAVCSR